MDEHQNSNRLPSSYFAGQEYFEDTVLDQMCVESSFYSAAILEPFELFIQNKKINGSQKGSIFMFTFDVALPRKLIDDLAWGKGNARSYIIGYISKYLPRVNQELLEQRYLSGHFLVQSFSTLDIFSIKVSNLKPEWADEVINVPWPPSFSHFPPVKKIQGEELETYLMDFIDAGNDYLRGDYNDCVRRIITSAENAFRLYGIDRVPLTWWKRYFSLLPFLKESGFSRTARSISSGTNLGRQVVSENLLFLYKLRNKIVHDKFRIRFENGWVCRKGLSTLNYLYQFLDRGGKTAEYVSFMEGQLSMLDRELKGATLESVKAGRDFIHNASDNKYIIDSDKKMNEWMFGSLRISEEDKIAVLKNKISHGNHKSQK